MRRSASYAIRHLKRAGFRALIPAFVIAIGATLIFTIQTLTSVVEREALEVVAEIGEDAAAQVVRASWVVSLVALLLGGFETAIIMSRAVYARRREIGVLRASGIGDRPIFQVFVIQSLAYGILGGLLGCIAGLGALLLVGLTAPDAVDIGVALLRVPFAAATAVGLSVVVAVVAGILPAQRAMRMPAIRAIYSAW
jgi:predicted lysophospholipase L1 biosynthesis ABC-type transport system permease subunit